MDVTRKFAAPLILILTACSSQKTPATVIQEGSPLCQETAITTQYVVEWEDGHHSLERARSRQEFIENFVKPNLQRVRRAEPDQVVRAEGAVVTPLETVPVNWGQDDVKAQAAWDQGVTGQGVIVAVVDSGVDASHPQLTGQIYTNPNEIAANGVDDDKNGFIDDVHGWNFAANNNNPYDDNAHGTHVSGVIAADPAAGPVEGIAPGAKILPLKFMDADGGGTIGAAIVAIEYAAKMGAKVINASWGTSSCVGSLRTTIAQLESRGVLFIAAAGNDGADLNYVPSYPAAYDVASQITVGALTYSGFRADFSDYGDLVHLVAPGSPIYSSVPTKLVSVGYAFMSGTSMAAPFVSGAAALLWSYKPAATVQEIKNVILSSVQVSEGLNVATQGQLDISAALSALGGP